MANETPVPLTGGLPETVLPDAPADATAALDAAVALPAGPDRAGALAATAARWPRLLAAWATLAGDALEAGRPVEAYAYARVGYHRGLDALRGAGWRGSGYVRWRAPSNRGFLTALDALRGAAAAIGEDDEATRCELFLVQLDPDWSRRTQ